MLLALVFHKVVFFVFYILLLFKRQFLLKGYFKLQRFYSDPHPTFIYRFGGVQVHSLDSCPCLFLLNS